MDIMIIFKMIGQLFIKICSMQVYIGGQYFSVGAFFLFAGLFSIAVWFVHKLAD